MALRSRALVGTAAALAVALSLNAPLASAAHPGRAGAERPPPKAGSFGLRGVGSWSKLPGDRICARRVHRSSWEPRPENWKPNHTMPNAAAVHASLHARPRSKGGAYRRRWDHWLLPRVDGHHTGTTDEIIQWAACKWGLPDNLLRAIAVRESTWFQALHFTDGSCYVDRGCGDVIASTSPATQTFCAMEATHGYDYQEQFGSGRCPETFSIAGVMSWQAPAWDRYPGNQNGTFPFNRDSTAFALDYLGAELRGCFEGWEPWLGHGYAKGSLWGCVGAWYAGAWLSPGARHYIGLVRLEMRRQVWRKASFRHGQYHCDPIKGCPV